MSSPTPKLSQKIHPDDHGLFQSLYWQADKVCSIVLESDNSEDINFEECFARCVANIPKIIKKSREGESINTYASKAFINAIVDAFRKLKPHNIELIDELSNDNQILVSQRGAYKLSSFEISREDVEFILTELLKPLKKTIKRFKPTERNKQIFILDVLRKLELTNLKREDIAKNFNIKSKGQISLICTVLREGLRSYYSTHPLHTSLSDYSLDLIEELK